MLNIPRIRCFYTARVSNPDQTFILSEFHQYVLRGRLFAELIPLIDGQNSTDDIADCLSVRYDFPHIYKALIDLEQQGITEEARKDALPRAVSAFWGLMGVEGAALQRLPQSRIRIISLGHLPLEGLAAALKQFGMEVAQTDLASLSFRSGDALWILPVRDYLEPEMEAIHRLCMRENQAWLPYKPVGVEVWLGPLFIPHRTGCWSCLDQRLRQHRTDHRDEM